MRVILPKRLRVLIENLAWVLIGLYVRIYLVIFARERSEKCRRCGHNIFWEGAIGLCFHCFNTEIDETFIKRRAEEIKDIIEVIRD